MRRARSALLKAGWAMASRLRVCWFRLQNDGSTIPWSTTIGAGVRIRVTDGGLLHLAGHVTLERNVFICAQAARVEIGARSFIGTGTIIAAKVGVSIGADALIAEYVTIRDQNHAIGPDGLARDSEFVVAPITIGVNVWLGAKATVLKGVDIGEGTVIGANAVVTHNVPPNCVAVGVPARVAGHAGENARPAGASRA
ncbi:MAG TPA: acyltransferase [Rhodanobacteraceae bacterium]|nr:acyltransferase [Rhodanobacteraceae bacterium]